MGLPSGVPGGILLYAMGAQREMKKPSGVCKGSDAVPGSFERSTPAHVHMPGSPGRAGSGGTISHGFGSPVAATRSETTSNIGPEEGSTVSRLAVASSGQLSDGQQLWDADFGRWAFLTPPEHKKYGYTEFL